MLLYVYYSPHTTNVNTVDESNSTEPCCYWDVFRETHQPDPCNANNGILDNNGQLKEWNLHDSDKPNKTCHSDPSHIVSHVMQLNEFYIQHSKCIYGSLFYLRNNFNFIVILIMGKMRC